MKTLSVIICTVAFLVGVVLGALGLFCAYLYKHQSTTVFTAKKTIQAGNGIIIPRGTELVYEHGLSEGIECVKLFINMTPSFANEAFEIRREHKSFLVIPHWVDESKSK